MLHLFTYLKKPIVLQERIEYRVAGTDAIWASFDNLSNIDKRTTTSSNNNKYNNEYE
jgi:hypothetical protein